MRRADFRGYSTYYNQGVSVGFSSDDELRERRRAELRQMTDDQLIEHGRTIKRIIGKPNPNVKPPEGFLRQLQDARDEWRRRHPPFLSAG
jgi:hypothetical protein